MAIVIGTLQEPCKELIGLKFYLKSDAVRQG